MNIPQSITLTEAEFWFDGGTISLHAVTETGDECRIRLNQRMFDTYANPGRLCFNDRPVDIRSKAESEIVDLLKLASVVPREAPQKLTDERISPNAIILGDDIKDVVNSSPGENLLRHRDRIVAYVESDEYVQIAKNGVPKSL
ncbi:MAG: hypothetical protein KDA88_12945 [Planctomycetaceae bacterium]|nr:hypothetical protein [Planctomycetaceae bacterium]